MSRFTDKVARETSIKLQRPSSTLCQSTSHVINSCFGDILQNDNGSLDAAQSLLALVNPGHERGDSRYAEKLQKAHAVYQQRMEELSSVEEHIVSAKTRALVDDEARLANLKREFSSCKEVILPEGPSSFRTYLDEDLLKRHSLLTPCLYFPDSQVIWDPPRAPTTPSYHQTTQSFLQHSKVKKARKTSDGRDEVVHKKKDEISREKHLWKGGMSAEERSEGKHTLAELSRKSEFLRNPRYKSTVLSNTAASATLKQATKLANEDFRKLDTEFFVSEPPEVVFSEYSIGKSHDATIVLKNVSSASHQLRILPPKSPYFTVSLGQFPTPDGLVAPGMSCGYKVTFTPDTLADFEDELTVLLHTGGSFSIPLKGSRLHPEITLPLELLCGTCMTGSSKEILFPCENNGGDGKFVFHAPKSSPNFKDIKGGWPEDGGEYRAGAFCITPSAFHLPPGVTVNIKVTFAPTVPGEYTETLSLSCDNCSSSQLTLSGNSEKLSIGVSEVESCSASDKSKTLSQADFRPSTSTSVSSLNLDYTEDTESSLLQTSVGHRESVFGTTNPCVVVNRRVRVKNLSESQLPFQWAVYRPLVHGALGDGDADSGVDTSALHQSSHSPFAIEPPCGCFEPAETKVFVMSFNPLHPGNYLDVAHLVLSGVPQVAVDEERFLVLEKERESEEKERTVCSVSAVSMELSGQCEAYRVELSPPFIGNLGCLSVGVELKRTVKVVNYSQCNVQFEWDWSMSCAVEGNDLGRSVLVRVDPPRGTVVAGCEATCSVCMLPKKHGVCSINLLANIKNVDKPLICPVTLDVKGPDLSIGVPSLDFNLVQVGKKSTLALPIRNDSCVPAQFTVSCLSQDTGDACLTNCIMMKVTGGELPPGGKTTLLVSFAPTTAGHLRALLRCSVEGSRSQFVAVTGEAQRPLVSLDTCHHHASGAFLNVPLKGSVLLRNQSVLPTHYTWSNKFIGEGAGLCNLTLSPCEGHIGPREEVSIEYEIIWMEKGHVPPVIATCFVDEMEHPLHLSLTADVAGISVHFDLLTENGEVISSSREDEVERKETLSFDFGDSCALGSDHCLLLRVTNLSGIAAKVASHVVNFPAAVVRCSQTPTGSTSKLSLSRRSLLPKTVNLGSSHSKADHQVERDLQKALLADGLGACFVVNPVEVDLLPFSSEIVSVKAYSDMWGSYQDEMIVKVEGMEERSFPISYCAVGCPIRFMNTCSSGSSSLRYGSHPVSTVPVKRSFKLQNTSPTDIRIDWETFCYLPESQDTQLVDLVVRVGEAFPMKDSVLTGEGSMGHARHSVSSTSLKPRVSAHRSWMAAKSGPLRSKWETKEKDSEELGENNPEESEEKKPEKESEEKNPEEPEEKKPEESEEKDPEKEFREKKSDDDIEDKADLSVSTSEDVISSPEDGGDTACCPSALSEPLIKCYITPHEGVHSSCPYTIEPPQLVLPAKSQSSITITFTPSLEALNVYGRHLGGYGIGFLSLDSPEESQYVSRASGDDVIPLRIDLVGCIEHPQLHLTSEDSETPNVLAVEERADVLFDGDVTDCSTGMVEESYFLHNSNSSQLSFTLSASPPFSLTTVNPGTKQDTSNLSIVLQPKKTLQVKVLLPLSIGDLRDLLDHKSEDGGGSSVPNSVGVNSQLTVNYSTGAVQAWPLTCTIKLPRLSVPVNAVSFAKCFVATRVSSTLTLRNLGYSTAYWSAKLSKGHPSFSISSSKGKLDPHLTHGRDSIHALVVSYHPLVEEEAGDVLVITEPITGWSTAIPLIGSSSTDEGHFVSYRQ